MRRAAKPPRRGVKLPAFLFALAWVFFAMGFQVITFLRDLLPGGEGLPETGFDGLGFSLVCLIFAVTLGWLAG